MKSTLIKTGVFLFALPRPGQPKTGENQTAYEYAPDSNEVQVSTLPNGCKFGYGRDLSDRVTSITQSTEMGEANTTDTKYTCGVITKLTSGNNTVNYAYDAKRRKTGVDLNGAKAVSYDYAENTALPVVTVITAFTDMTGSKADKVTATLADGTRVDTYTDKQGRANIYSFDITSISNENNFVCALRSTNETSVTGLITINNAPNLVVFYQSACGINDNFAYNTHDAGRAGQGNVNLLTGALTFIHKDIEWSGNKLPLNIFHVYNSVQSERVSYFAPPSFSDGFANPLYCGKGWKLNYQQFFKCCYENCVVKVGATYYYFQTISTYFPLSAQKENNQRNERRQRSRENIRLYV